ncbi:MAG TPA: molecular chaperone TorD family protein [Burkholderiaceae bacterium]|nr:molecular chaperone TorD family protein [Burkholderiaceae bacterium]
MTNQEALIAEASEQDEELARADWYGTLASLFCAPPSQELLDRIAAANLGGGGLLQDAWGELAVVAGKMDAEAVKDEYERLFIGVGKPEVMLYGSYYLSGFLMEKPLVALRTDLSVLGLQRAETMVESEDHIAALCEVMRYLITSDDVRHTGLSAQKKFFADHLQPWVNTLWETLEQRADAVFYAPAAHVARCYFEIEMQAFDLFA